MSITSTLFRMARMSANARAVSRGPGGSRQAHCAEGRRVGWILAHLGKRKIPGAAWPAPEEADGLGAMLRSFARHRERDHGVHLPAALGVVEAPPSAGSLGDGGGDLPVEVRAPEVPEVLPDDRPVSSRREPSSSSTTGWGSGGGARVVVRPGVHACLSRKAGGVRCSRPRVMPTPLDP